MTSPKPVDRSQPPAYVARLSDLSARFSTAIRLEEINDLYQAYHAMAFQ